MTLSAVALLAVAISAGGASLTQEEFSNQDFFRTGLGCLQGE